MKPEPGPIVQSVEGPFPVGPARVITLRRRGNSPLGFSIRGGWEHGTGIFISEVQPVSEAHRQGLRAGDQIIRVNGFSIQRAIHQEVLTLLKTKPGVVLTVKRVGVIPVKDKGSDQLIWKTVDPGPSPSSSILEGTNSISSVESCQSDPCSETKIYIPDSETSGLGCSAVNGPPELPGIFVSHVKPRGQADIAGLQIGDQIVSANGFSFLNVKFSEAISLLKSFKELHLTVKKQAGLELFTNNLPVRDLRNGESEDSERRVNGNGYVSVNGLICNNRVNGLEQNGCSCESEKDFSLTEVEEEAQWTDSTDYFRRQNGLLPGGRTKLESFEDPRLAEEKRKLLEEKKRLEEEKEKLQEERKRTNEEICSSLDRHPKQNFISEIQRIAEKMSNRKGKEDNSQIINENPKFQEEVMKRQQHEMLMEEIHLAHRKMFGERKPMIGRPLNKTSEYSMENKTKTVPFPPPKPNSLMKTGTLPAHSGKQYFKSPEEEKNQKELWKCSKPDQSKEPPEVPLKKVQAKSVHFSNGQAHVKLFNSSNLQRQKHVTTRRKSSDLSNIKVSFDSTIPDPSENESTCHIQDVETYTFVKNGPLNIKMEGGIYSASDCSIVVGELWEGGFIPLDGRIQVGDQILKIDEVNLENVSLTFASAALRDAMISSKEDIRITVKKSFKENTANEHQ